MAKLKGDNRKLKGGQKAAVFMLALGPDYSAKLFELMDDEEIRDLSQSMSTLGGVESNTVESLFVEFADQLSGSGGNLNGSFDSTERLLFNSLPEDRVNAIMEEMRGPAGRTMWDKLDNVNESVLANYFKNEYPQTVAVVLSKIKADHASKVLALLPENFAMEVIMRMLRMEAVQKDVLDNVERTLRTEFMTNLARSARTEPHEMMADIFNGLDRNTENQFMSGLEERNRESAEKIKSLMFTFDDLAKVDAAGVQVILRQVEKDQLAMALKGGSDDVKDLFFGNMSERAGKMMKEDMEAMGAVRLRDVDEAQSAIVQVAKALADAGEIVIAVGGEDDEFVY
ncbi:MAG: flagellar motor switch protein FliG [Rhodospirillales bacterium]|nr:flagellar motor switch protein FliG [Rhodospirillaceae bacterium]MBT8003967.1 flagellar motor switch protein FliG [Rhodospirillales bacterium]